MKRDLQSLNGNKDDQQNSSEIGSGQDHDAEVDCIQDQGRAKEKRTRT